MDTFVLEEVRSRFPRAQDTNVVSQSSKADSEDPTSLAIGKPAFGSLIEELSNSYTVALELSSPEALGICLHHPQSE